MGRSLFHIDKKKIPGSIIRLMNCYEKSSLISIGFIPNLLVVAEAKAGFLQLAVLLVLVVA